MRTKQIILFFISLAVINSQVTGLGDANTCAKTALGDSLPTSRDICFADTSNPNNQCCLVSSTLSGLNMNFCSSIPKGTDLTQITKAIQNLGATASIVCSANMVSYTVMILLLIIFGLL